MARVIATEQINATHQRGLRLFELLPGDIVTAQARETAQRLGVALLDGPLERPVAVRTDGATAMRRSLYRRNPGWRAPEHNKRATARRINRLALVGAGGVGANIAHLCASANSAQHIALIDITPGLAESIALDLRHTSGISRSSVSVVGGSDLSLVAGADVVVVTAGRPRTPGMTRADLIQTNRRVIMSTGQAIADHAPGAIVIVVTNPLDEMTVEMQRATGFDRSKIIGMAGTLDSSRFRQSIADAAKVAVADVEAVTLGSHGEEMVPVVSRATVRGRALSDWLTPQQIDDCVRTTIGGGGAVVALRRSGSATLAPAHATVELIDHIRGARAGAVPASVMLQGEYGIDGVVLGVMCQFGASGLLQIDEVSLSPQEQQALKDAATAIAGRLAQ